MRSNISNALMLLGVVALAVAPGSAVAQTNDDAFFHVPTQEISEQQIGWYVNRSQDAFAKAVEEQKPLVIVFGSSESPLTQRVAKYVAPCPQLNQLAGVAVFAYGSPLVDEFLPAVWPPT